MEAYEVHLLPAKGELLWLQGDASPGVRVQEGVRVSERLLHTVVVQKRIVHALVLAWHVLDDIRSRAVPNVRLTIPETAPPCDKY